MTQRRQFLQTGGAVALAAAWQHAALAAPHWPGDRPVRLIVPASAGGSLDTLARPLAQAMATLSGGRFIVENQGGAAGMIGAATVARSAPDGQTLLLGGVHHMIIPIAYSKLPYDTARDLLPVALIASVPNVVLVRKSSPIRTIAELVQAGKASASGLNYGTGGQGGLHHLTSEHFSQLTGTPMQAVHYKGSAPAVADLMGGQIDVMFETMPNALSQVRAGTLRALAVTSAQRSQRLPEVPTLAQAGVPGLVVDTWYGIFSPARLPPGVQIPLQALVRNALAGETLQALWRDYGATVDGPGAQDFQGFVTDQLRHWRELSAQIGFRPGG